MRLIPLILALLVLIGLVLATAGVMYVQNTDDKASIIIDKQKLEEKTHETIDKTKKAGSESLEKMSKALHQSSEELKDSSNERKAQGTTEQPLEKENHLTPD